MQMTCRGHYNCGRIANSQFQIPGSFISRLLKNMTNGV
jgi:hypothetical protein